MKSRILYLDIIRGIACLMIILMHAPKPYSANSMVLSGISLMTAPSIGLFFMISGALILPVIMSTQVFLKRRLTKIAIPAVLWSLIFLLVKFFEDNNWEAFLKSIISIPFSTQGCAVYWFIYALAGLYLIAPIISPWLHKTSKREIEIFLLFWLVTLCEPVLRPYISINENYSKALYYFGGYVGYFILGYYLHNYTIIWKKWILVAMLIVPLCSAAICKLTDLNINFYDMFWYLTIPSASMCTALFLLAKKYFESKSVNRDIVKFITNFSKCSFGIFLIHFFILRNILWKFDLTFIPYGGGIFETFILATTSSYLITYLISYFSMSEYLIGYRRK